jgi:hypothetical protein
MRLSSRAVALSLAVLHASCSDASNGDTNAADARQRDGGPDTNPAPAPTPSATTAPPPPSLDCLGESRALTVDRNLPFVDVTVGAGGAQGRGAFLIDLATTSSTIDLGAFSPEVRSGATNCDATLLGQWCSFADLEFFGSFGRVTLRTDDHRLPGAVRQAGILGTDFLSNHTFTIDLGAARVHRAKRGELCADATLTRAGLTALSTAGFYSHDLSLLRPMRDVDPQAAPEARVPNVPTVSLSLAGKTAWTQLDTGFADTLVPYSVNVNAAFFDTLPPQALRRTPSRDLALTTCVGLAETVEAYELAPGFAIEVGPRRFANAVLFVNRTPAAARVCGGIGTWAAPAAQLGASFFRAFGVTVFDPFSARVWVKQ